MPTPTGKKTSTFGNKDISIGMNIQFNEVTVIPEIKAALGRAIWAGMKYFKTHFEKLIMTPLMLGGPGWKSVETLPSWKWINSPDGMGQLGFTDANEPLVLLLAMLNSYDVFITGKPGVGKRGRLNIRLEMRFFDVSELIRATRHPAAGEGALSSDRSWFEWIYKGLAITERGRFVKRAGGAGVKSARSYPIAGAGAGVMSTKGSSLWSVPPRFRLDLDTLIKRNETKIIQVMNDTIARQMNAYLGT